MHRTLLSDHGMCDFDIFDEFEKCVNTLITTIFTKNASHASLILPSFDNSVECMSDNGAPESAIIACIY